MKNCIKKRMFILILVIVLGSLTACINRKTQYFAEGNFIGELDSITYYLDVEKIDLETFNSLDGKNVIKDVVLKEPNCYFLIDFYYFEGDEKIQCDFLNLKDLGPKAQPISYVDSNNNRIAPFKDDITLYLRLAIW